MNFAVHNIQKFAQYPNSVLRYFYDRLKQNTDIEESSEIQ